MKIPFLKTGEESRYEKARKRLSVLDSNTVCTWGMDSLWATQEGLEQYQMHNDAAGLQQARQGLVAMLAVTDVLLERDRA